MATDMKAILDNQRAAFEAARPESMSVRKDRLKRLIAMIKDNGEEFARAMSRDFGHRSHEQSMMTDIVPSISAVKY
ncbi:MAG: coniferyl aldehyde dehydrogenase, partial [Sphingomonadales bacterium]